MEKEKELNLDDSLKIIRQMVNAGETRLNDRGIHFIVWGAMISLGAIIQFLFFKKMTEDTLGFMWSGGIIGTFFISVFYEVRYFRPHANDTMFDKIFFRIVVAFGFLLANTICVAIGFKEINPIPFVSLELCAFYAVVSILFEFSGVIGKSPGSGLFILVLLSAKGSVEKTSIMLAVISLFTLILPGILLYRKSINKPLFKKSSND